MPRSAKRRAFWRSGRWRSWESPWAMTCQWPGGVAGALDLVERRRVLGAERGGRRTLAELCAARHGPWEDAGPLRQQRRGEGGRRRRPPVGAGRRSVVDRVARAVAVAHGQDLLG